MRTSVGIFFLITVLTASGTASGQGPERKPRLPHFGAVKFIDADQYKSSEDLDPVFTPGQWKEIMGVWALHTTSSGIHNYYGIEFSSDSAYIIKSGKQRMPGAETGKDHRETVGTYAFDKENDLLYLHGDDGEKVYSVEYFLARETEDVRYREILVLTYQGETDFGRIPTTTFIRR